ncbi:MAG: pitrilysin family protein [Gemmatimonadales bacterium]|nr:pitrilysin family protein [Gemmatimonadales bacterium]MDZ4391284.1 pitrilysin family protein [Gemmatimonadales bacterium]
MTGSPTAGLRREVLPNGVTLLVQRRLAAPAAAIVTHVRAGFLDEPDDLVGISHVLEHLVFKGTPRLAPGELARGTKALGGALNAYTSYDRTVYYASVPSRNARAALALQADSVRDPLVDAEELRRELGVIVQEAERKLDTPSAVVGEVLHELLYDNHRIRRWRIGTAERIAAFTRDDVLGYHATRYLPSRVIASMVSDLEDEHALDLLRAEWGSWQRPAVPIPDGPPESGLPSVRARAVPGDVSHAETVLGWRAPGPLHELVPAFEVLAAILSTGRGARLARLLREPGLVSGVGASHYGAEDVGVLAIGLTGDPIHLPEALDLLAGTLADLRENGPEPAEVARAQALLLARNRRQLEWFEARAIALAAAEGLGDVTRLDRDEARLTAVTPEQLRDVVRDWLSPTAMSGVASLPRDATVRFDSELLAAAVGRAASRPSPLSAGPAITAPTVLIRPTTLAHGVHHLAIDGIDILTARHGSEPQVSLSAWRRRDQVEGPGDAGLSVLALRSMLRGTERRDATELALAMERLGGVLSASAGGDSIGLGTTVLAEHVADAAALLAETLYRPRFDPRLIEVERLVLVEEAAGVSDDMFRFPIQLALGAAFRDLGYGSPGLGTAESLAKLDAAAVSAWHAEGLARGRTTVVAVGDVEPERLAGVVATAFAADARGQAHAAESVAGAVELVSGERRRIRDRRQSAFAMLFPGPSRRDPARFAAEVWGAIAGGLGGRLFDALRDHRSLAYSVVAAPWQRRRAGALLTYIATAPERLEEARQAMIEELAGFRNAPPTNDELTRAVGMLVGQTELARQTAGAVAGEIADAWLAGDGLAELDDPTGGYRRVTAREVQEVAAGLDPARMAEGVVTARGDLPE